MPIFLRGRRPWSAPQIVSGTHALAVTLFGIAPPGRATALPNRGRLMTPCRRSSAAGVKESGTPGPEWGDSSITMFAASRRTATRIWRPSNRGLQPENVFEEARSPRAARGYRKRCNQHSTSFSRNLGKEIVLTGKKTDTFTSLPGKFKDAGIELKGLAGSDRYWHSNSNCRQLTM